MRAATPPELSVKRWHWWHWWRLHFGLFSGLRVGLFLGLVLAGTLPVTAQEDRLDFARGEIALVGINDSMNAGSSLRLCCLQPKLPGVTSCVQNHKPRFFLFFAQ